VDLIYIALAVFVVALALPVWFRLAHVRNLVRAQKELGRHYSVQEFVNNNPTRFGVVVDVYAGSQRGIWWIKTNELPENLDDAIEEGGVLLGSPMELLFQQRTVAKLRDYKVARVNLSSLCQ